MDPIRSRKIPMASSLVVIALIAAAGYGTLTQAPIPAANVAPKIVGGLRATA